MKLSLVIVLVYTLITLVQPLPKHVPLYAFSEDGSSIKLIENPKDFISTDTNNTNLKIINVNGMVVPFKPQLLLEMPDTILTENMEGGPIPQIQSITETVDTESTPIISSIALILFAVILGVCTITFTAIFLVMCIQSIVGVSGTINPLSGLG